VAVASAGSYANHLHLAADMPVPHHSVFTGQMPLLPPNQQCQTTEGSCKAVKMQSDMFSFLADSRLLELMERTWQALSVDQSQLGRISFGRLLRQTNGAFSVSPHICEHVLCVYCFDLLQITFAVLNKPLNCSDLNISCISSVSFIVTVCAFILLTDVCLSVSHTHTLF